MAPPVDLAEKPKLATYPAAAVEAYLKTVLLETVQATASFDGIPLPPSLPAQCGAVVQIDSLDVVDLLCGVEPIVGFTLKDSIVKAGGYKSVNAALAHLLPRVEAAWNKNNHGGGSKP